MDRCFIVVPPGFEEEVHRELLEVWPDLLDASARPHAVAVPEVRFDRGGIEFPCELFTAVQLNFFLKTASRVLFRLDEFRVRDFPKLHERLRRLDVKSWTGEEGMRFEAAAQGSRLNHERRIQETALSAWKMKEDEKAALGIYLRMQNDLCTVSLDTSGEHLHRRGVNVLRGEAPMRETLAAYCLRKMIGETSPGELKDITLVDPMCGSGTLLTEALGLWGGSFARSYAFQSFRRLPKLFQQPGFERNYRLLARPPFRHLIGADMNERIVEAAQGNLQKALASVPSDTKIESEIFQEDVFSDEALHPAVASGRRWVVANPPYGERLEAPPMTELFEGLCRRWNPERVGMLVPEKDARSLQKLKTGQWIAAHPVRNGGLDCRFVVWQSE